MHEGPTRSNSKSSTSSQRSHRRSSSETRPTQSVHPPTLSPPPQSQTAPPSTQSNAPRTTQDEQDVITQSRPPVATQLQLSKLHEGDVKQYPPNTLNNKYGEFQVEHGVGPGPLPFGRGYSTEIEMNPNWRTRDPKSLGTRGSDIDFVQVVRSGTGNNWKTTAKDHGHTGQTDESGKPLDEEGNPKFLHRAELTEQQTGKGWRVDQSQKNTPFHQEALPEDPAQARAGRHHLLKENEPARLSDRPAIAGPGYKFDAMSTAMNKKTGKEFGTVEWGFHVDQNKQGEPILRPHTPTLLEDNLKLDGEPGRQAHERNRGRIAAYEQWNQAVPMKEQANIAEVNRLKNEGVQAVRPPQQVTRLPRPRRGSTSTN